MLGNANSKYVRAKLPKGWALVRHEGRNQPYTLMHALAYDRHIGKFYVIWFSDSVEEAEIVAKKQQAVLDGAAPIRRMPVS